MATSGTVGQTIINTATVLEHALRRCGIFPHQQTPEIVDTAKESLYLLLTHYANRGINLWCVKRNLLWLKTGVRDYTLPTGVLNMLETLFRNTEYTDSTDVVSTTSVTSTLASSATVAMIGVVTDATTTLTLRVDTSTDGSTWTALQTFPATVCTANERTWFELANTDATSYIRIVETVLADANLDSVYYVTDYTDMNMYRMNRDEYAYLPTKNTTSTQQSQYWFNRQITPTISVWPVPENDDNVIAYFAEYQIEDVGTLSQQLAIPNRWFESTIWQLSLRLCFELPGVTPDRVKMVSEMAEKYQFETENEETDHAGIYIQPSISVYTS